MTSKELGQMLMENIRDTLASHLGGDAVIDELARRSAASVFALLSLAEVEDACPLCGTVMPDTVGVNPQVLFEALIERMKRTADIRLTAERIDASIGIVLLSMLDEMARDAAQTAIGVFLESRVKAGRL